MSKKTRLEILDLIQDLAALMPVEVKEDIASITPNLVNGKTDIQVSGTSFDNWAEACGAKPEAAYFDAGYDRMWFDYNGLEIFALKSIRKEPKEAHLYE